MNILITGGAGFLGHRLARRLLELGSIPLSGEARHFDNLVLLDSVEGPAIEDARVRSVRGDVDDETLIDSLIDEHTGVIFHLAAVVSGQAEADFDLGMRINVDASRGLLEACRRRGHAPRVIFTSSVAVYGGELPQKVRDDTALKPRSSYGVEKAMAELLLAEYTRRGFVDGRALRLPTVSVRPGRPNQAASSFASGIIREPLAGEDAPCPVEGDTRLWLMSPRVAVRSLVHGAGLDSAVIGDDRALNLTGLSVTVSQMLEALGRVAGENVVKRVRFEPDENVRRIVGGWPAAWDTSRALALGFPAIGGFEDVIREHIEDTGSS